ncbi:MAG: CPBP family intramembrane glutamic endopeptidase [Polyangiales bacterium]
MQQRSTTRFFLWAYALTWLPQLPSVLARRGVIAGPPEKYLALAGLGALGPMIAAVIESAREDGREGVRALFRPMKRWSMAPYWYAVALLLPGALLAAGLAGYGLVTGRDPGPLLYPPIEPERIVAAALFPLGEEIGWRGYAQPRLTASRGPLAASAIIGALWAFWHLPMFDLAALPLRVMLSTLPMFIAGGVLFTWLYVRTGGSLLLAVLLHVGAHLNNSHRALPSNPVPAAVHTVMYVLFAIALLVLDRETFARSSAPRATNP